jgi:hypothetical protein
MSRSGARTELLKGPVVYGSVITVATLLFWRRPAAVGHGVKPEVFTPDGAGESWSPFHIKGHGREYPGETLWSNRDGY